MFNVHQHEFPINAAAVVWAHHRHSRRPHELLLHQNPIWRFGPLWNGLYLNSHSIRRRSDRRMFVPASGGWMGWGGTGWDCAGGRHTTFPSNDANTLVK